MKTEKLTMNDLAKAAEGQSNHPWGYLGHEVRNENGHADRIFLEACNKLGLEYKAMVIAGESKQGRHLGDYLACVLEDKTHDLVVAGAIKSIASALEESGELEAVTDKVLAKRRQYKKEHLDRIETYLNKCQSSLEGHGMAALEIELEYLLDSVKGAIKAQKYLKNKNA